jgi:outer membrane lipoprotein-sorting protein
MKKIILSVLISFLGLNAQDIDIPASFKANFVQQIKNTRGKIIKYRGKIYYNYPDTTKWIYRSPTRKDVCSSDGKVIVIDHDLEQASYYKVDRGLNLAKVLKRAKHHKGNLYVTKYKGKYYTIVLNKRGQINQIAYKDNLDNTVNLMFTHIRYGNNPMPTSRFICAKPASYDSIH